MHSEPRFFVVGFPRSGTTLLASMLNRHSQICVPPETQFFRKFMRKFKPWPNLSKEELIGRFVAFPRICDLDVQPDDLTDLPANILEQPEQLLAAALTSYARRAGKSIVGEKTPAHALYLPTIEAAFPEAKFIAIVRDGRDCVFSNVRQAWTGNSAYRHSAEWNYYAEKIEAFKRRHPSKILVVRLEDLLGRPEQFMREIADFIEIDFEIGQLQATHDDNVVPAWEADWKKQSQRAPDAGNRFPWRQHADHDLIVSLTQIMRHYLDHYGYDLEPIENEGVISSTFRRWRHFWLLPAVYSAAKDFSRTDLFYPFHRLGLSRIFFGSR